MLEVVKEMCIQFYSKNNYIISKRNFSDDYANTNSGKIDMTLSGKYLYKYPEFDFDIQQLSKYPSKYDAEKLMFKISEKFKLKNSIILGPGANGILQNIIKLVLKKGENLVTPFYTFNQAEYSTTAFGGITRRVKCVNYKIDFTKMKKSINRKTKIVYICNPNNPTGIYTSSNKIIEFAISVDCIVIVDESGIEFTNKKSILDYKSIPDNVIVLRSFSKAYGLANARLGYMFCSNKFEKYYLANTTINEYSGLSVLFAMKMLDNFECVLKNIELINQEKLKIISELKKINILTIDSDSNTIMTKSLIDNYLFDELFQNDISLIKVYDESNNIHFRIAVQDAESNEMFIKRLKLILKREEVNNENFISN